MGRPLKIKHSTIIDIGFNNWGSLTDPTIPGTMTNSEYLGVVGGGYPSGIATAAYPTVKCTAYIVGSAAEDDAYIITQKGATKYLVVGATAVDADQTVAGGTYVIASVGDTNWAAIGAGVEPTVGDIFTATGVGAGTGTVSYAGICALADEAAGAVTEGNMQINFDDDGTTVQASRLTNKYVWDYSVPPVRYAANFFEAAGDTTAKSGAEIETWANGTGELTLGQVDNYTA